MFGKCRGFGKVGEVVEEAKLASVEGVLESLQEQASKQPREHAHRQEEAGATSDPAGAVERGPTTRHDAVDMRVVLQGLAQVWRTMVKPSWAPRCLRSAAMAASVSAAVRNRIAY